VRSLGPGAEWIANQLTAACGWAQLPHYLIRDPDTCYGGIFVRRVRSLGIRDHPTSPRSPWQNGYAERLIGSIRRECLDHSCCGRRAAPAPHPYALHDVLQCSAHASIVRQGSANWEGYSVRRAHRSATCAWWTAPSVRADLICGRDSRKPNEQSAHVRHGVGIIHARTRFFPASRTASKPWASALRLGEVAANFVDFNSSGGMRTLSCFAFASLRLNGIASSSVVRGSTAEQAPAH
jgi:transposase InsO family protein